VETLICNLFGGPGLGKSTLMAAVFAELKFMDINCEMAPEYAKEKVWEGSLNILDNQIYIFGKQYHTINRLIGKVEVIVTDSPLFLSLVYGECVGIEFRDLVLKTIANFNNLNFLVERSKPYNSAGRVQDEAKARDLDRRIRDFLGFAGIPFISIPYHRDSVYEIVEQILFKIHWRERISTKCQ